MAEILLLAISILLFAINRKLQVIADKTEVNELRQKDGKPAKVSV